MPFELFREDHGPASVEASGNSSASREATSDSSEAGDIVGAVSAVIRETIEFDRPTLAKTAKRLDIRLRTLQRLLAASGTTFHGTLDDVRKANALRYLQQGEHSITTIALRLGYSDSSHFSRAFRRWTGRSPSELIVVR